MEVKFFASVKFVCIKREFNIKKVYLMYSGFKEHCYRMRGTAVAQWLRRCATNWKVAGSIPLGVIGIFH